MPAKDAKHTPWHMHDPIYVMFKRGSALTESRTLNSMVHAGENRKRVSGNSPPPFMWRFKGHLLNSSSLKFEICTLQCWTFHFTVLKTFVNPLPHARWKPPTLWKASPDPVPFSKQQNEQHSQLPDSSPARAPGK